jgi:hypothetical protein
MYSHTSRITRRGKTYTRHLVRASYRANGKVLHRTSANLRQCSAAESEAIRVALRHKEALENLGPIQDAITLTPGRSLGAVWTVSHVARRWGIAKALGPPRAGQLALGHGMARVIAPGSRLAAVRLAMAHAACDVLGGGPFDAEALYENLDGLARGQASLEERLFAQRSQTKPVNLFLSEVTRRSLEGTHHARAAFGAHRAGKTGQLPMVIGLRCAEAGEPVASAVWPGQTPAPRPVASQREKGKPRVGVTAITFVGDRGLSKGQPRADLAPQGLPSITASTQPQIETRLRTGGWQMALCAQEVGEGLAEEGRRSVLRRHPGRAPAMRDTRPAKLAPLQAQGAKQNHYRTAPPRANPQGALPKRMARAEKLRSTAWVELTVAERTSTLTLKEDAQTEAATRAGCYGRKTALTPAPAPKEMGHDRYKELASVAQAFRTCKTAHLEVRPLFLRRAARTRAHALGVLLAYPIMRSRTSCGSACDVTVAEGLHALTTLCLVDVAPPPAPSSHCLPTPRDAIARLLHSADLTLPKAFALSGVRVSTKKKLQSERRP